MARFYGKVGYIIEDEAGVDIIAPNPYERYYKGDLVKNRRKLEAGISTNDNVTLANQISIVADPYALSHFFAIRYVTWMGASWKVSEVEVAYPRLILTIGGVYNGETADETE